MKLSYYARSMLVVSKYRLKCVKPWCARTTTPQAHAPRLPDELTLSLTASAAGVVLRGLHLGPKQARTLGPEP